MKIARRILFGAGRCRIALGTRPRPRTRSSAARLAARRRCGRSTSRRKKASSPPQDLDVEINFAQSGAAVTQQLTAGAFDVVLSVGINDPIHAVDKGAALAMIRIIGDAAPYALIGKPGLKTIADLKGKSISVGQVNDPTTYYFERMAAANGLKTGDYDESARRRRRRRALPRSRPALPTQPLVLPPLNFQADAAGLSRSASRRIT